jgi:hypothetical protein
MASVASTKVPQRAASSTGVFLLAALVICVVVFSMAHSNLVIRWNRQEEYSHGFLIPVIAAWLLWTGRDALRASIGRPSWVGLLRDRQS